MSDIHSFKKEAAEEKYQEFREELTSLINGCCLESGSDTPDYVLADYLVECLRNFNKTIKLRDKHYAFNPFGDILGEPLEQPPNRTCETCKYFKETDKPQRCVRWGSEPASPTSYCTAYKQKENAQ